MTANADLDALIAACAPVFHFHSEEEDFPVAVDHYLDHVQVIDRATRKVVGHLSPPTHQLLDQLRGDEVYDLERVVPVHSSPQRIAPSLVHVVHRSDRLFLQYILFYARNGPSWVPLLCSWIGEHQADIEVVLVEIVDGRPVAYHMSRHNDQDEVLIPIEELEPVDGHPLAYHVYVARGGHSHYERAGHHSRLCGLTADECDDLGVAHRPTRFQRLYDPDTPGYDPHTMGFLRLVHGRVGGGLSAVGTWSDRLGIVGRVISLPARPWWTRGCSRLAHPFG